MIMPRPQQTGLVILEILHSLLVGINLVKRLAECPIFRIRYIFECFFKLRFAFDSAYLATVLVKEPCSLATNLIWRHPKWAKVWHWDGFSPKSITIFLVEISKVLLRDLTKWFDLTMASFAEFPGQLFTNFHLDVYGVKSIRGVS